MLRASKCRVQRLPKGCPTYHNNVTAMSHLKNSYPADRSLQEAFIDGARPCVRGGLCKNWKSSGMSQIVGARSFLKPNLVRQKASFRAIRRHSIRRHSIQGPGTVRGLRIENLQEGMLDATTPIMFDKHLHKSLPYSFSGRLRLRGAPAAINPTIRLKRPASERRLARCG